ncbi:MAG: PHP domain-containing protein [Oscillospiraceae bacterium]|nr:PHP domain-containing protein [Oscillospiraceae bacterium]
MLTYISKSKPQYKANLHCHSTLSDGKLTPEELKAAYKSAGYSILAITDHENPHDHSDMTEDDFLMLTGYEAYIRPSETGTYDQFQPEVHINLFARDPHNVGFVNYSEPYCKYVKDPAEREAFIKVGADPARPREYTAAYINEFVQTAKDNGYLAAYNHAVWSLEYEEMILNYRGFFSMEMCNYSSWIGNRMEYNAALYDKLLRQGVRLFVHSADDNHNKAPFGSPYCDSFGGYTMILAESLTYEAVIDALEKGNFYSSMGPTINELTFDGSHVHIETEPAQQISMFIGGKKVYFEAGTPDSPVTSADFDIPENAPFVRFSVYDFNGHFADTRGFFRDELGI